MPTETKSRLAFVEGLVHKIAESLVPLIDRDLNVGAITCDVATERPAGKDCIHVSFKLGFTIDGTASHGCVLVPLPDAIALGGYLMMMSDAVVKRHRGDSDIDAAMKDAMLELGNFVAGAADDVMRSYVAGASVRPEGCQGVRADVRPALEYVEGDELVVGRAVVRLAKYSEFELIVVLPIVPGLE